VNTVNRIMVLALTVAISGLFAASAVAHAVARTITVNGTGVVNTVPTQAEFTFGVTTTGKTATAALTTNGTAMNKLVAAIEAQGIKAADIQTAQILLTPNENPAGNLILNYTATNSVSVLVRSIANAGPLIDAAVQAGANNVGGPSLTAGDSQALSRQALKAAVSDARGRAEALAGAAHVALGNIISISETSSSTPLPFTPIAAAKSSSTPVSAGTIQVEADITAVFAIR
jgi:uncharacterized protein